jgi:hypothetical protein
MPYKHFRINYFIKGGFYMRRISMFLLAAVLLLSAVVLVPLDASARVPLPPLPPPIPFPVPPIVAVIPGTYVYFAPDVEADILFYSGWWYRPFEDRWYRAKSYNGPWKHIRRGLVPAPLIGLPGDYRHGVIHDRIEYDHLHRNWRSWERDRHWHRHYNWEDRQRDRNERQEHRQEMRHDRQEHRQEMRHDRQEHREERRHDRQEHRRDRH